MRISIFATLLLPYGVKSTLFLPFGVICDEGSIAIMFNDSKGNEELGKQVISGENTTKELLITRSAVQSRAGEPRKSEVYEKS